jgi:hypothetical protein
MRLNELFGRKSGDNQEEDDRIAAIRAKASSFDQERQQRLSARSNRVMSPEQIARVKQAPQDEKPFISPQRAFDLFKQKALELSSQPTGYQMLLQAYKELKGSNDPLARQKREYIHELITSPGSFRRGVSAGYR